MSKYTTEVRYLCETGAGLTESVGYNSVNDVLDKSWANIFNFEFPIFDEEYRSVLCKKILKHYYTREIAYETVGVWKLHLDSRMNEIMPYYNKLYSSELISIDPLNDVNVTTTHEKSNTSESETNGSYSSTGTLGTESETTVANTSENSSSTSVNTTSSTNDKDRYSDTPQGSLQNIESNTYLTNARIKDTDNTGTSVETATANGKADSKENYKIDTNSSENRTTGEGTKANSTEEYVTKIIGKSGSRSYSKMLQEYRETFLNIDLLIINELSDLFMGIW